MDKRTKNFIVGSLAVAAAAVALYLAFADRSPKVNLDSYEVLGLSLIHISEPTRPY